MLATNGIRNRNSTNTRLVEMESIGNGINWEWNQLGMESIGDVTRHWTRGNGTNLKVGVGADERCGNGINLGVGDP